MLYLEGNVGVSIDKCRSERITGRPLCLDGSSAAVSENFLQNVTSSVIPLKCYREQVKQREILEKEVLIVDIHTKN